MIRFDTLIDLNFSFDLPSIPDRRGRHESLLQQEERQKQIQKIELVFVFLGCLLTAKEMGLGTKA